MSFGEKKPWQCPESTGPHSPLDAYGKCEWCGRKIEPTRPRPAEQPMSPTELSESYGRMFDPDWDSLSPDDIRWRMKMGQL